MIKITKTLIGKKGRIVVSPSYISNGHWIVGRNEVSNEKEYACAVIQALGSGAIQTDEIVHQLFPSFQSGKPPTGAVAFTWTRQVYAGVDRDYAIFNNPNTQAVVWFDRAYIEGLGLTNADLFPIFYDDLSRPFIANGGIIGLMPCKQVDKPA